jgi:hypothetical protein
MKWDTPSRTCPQGGCEVHMTLPVSYKTNVAQKNFKMKLQIFFTRGINDLELALMFRYFERENPHTSHP